MSFNPNRDGSKIWTYWHLMAANATTPKKRAFLMNWVNDQKDVFPCEICRQHLVGNLETLPVEPYGNTNVSLFLHSWKIHDTVNKQLKKPTEQCLSYEQAFAIYFPNTTGPGAGHVSQPHAHMNSSNNIPVTTRPQSTVKTQASHPQKQMSAQKTEQSGDYERHLVAGSNQFSADQSVAHQSPHQCQSCQQEPPEFHKTDYQEFRQKQRTVYLPKN